MRELKASTFVERVWYLRISGNKEVARLSLLESLKGELKKGESLNEKTLAIKEVFPDKKGGEDRVELIATAKTNEIEVPNHEVPNYKVRKI